MSLSWARLLRSFAALFLLGSPAVPVEGAAPWGPFVEPGFPFHGSVLDLRGASGSSDPAWVTPRGVVVRLEEGLWACYDTELLRVSAWWEGPGVTPISMAQGSYHESGHKAPEGEDALPAPMGTRWMTGAPYPGWQAATRFSTVDPRDPGPDPRATGRGPLAPEHGRLWAVTLQGSRIRFESMVFGRHVVEELAAIRQGGRVHLGRRVRVEEGTTPLALVLGRLEPGVELRAWRLVEAAGASDAVLPVRALPDGVQVLDVPAAEVPSSFEVWMARADAGSWARPATGSETPVPAGSARRWPESVTTRGELAKGGGAWRLDRVPLPQSNPWRRQLRCADLAFFPGNSGRAALVTFDGDVWIGAGMKGDLQEIVWTRFASGLHEPLGVAMQDGQVHVHDRNGIWRLLDLDFDGEADRYELVSNDAVQTAETREFAVGLRAEPLGGWVVAQGGQRGGSEGRHAGRILRVRERGNPVEELGWGFRQAFIGVHPDFGWVTASDQQGHYVPATPLHWLGTNAYHGFIPVFRGAVPDPAPVVPPLTWIPHAINPSGAGQVWVSAGSRMGPLDGALLHLGYYRPEIFRVLLGEREGSGVRHAAVVSLVQDPGFPLLSGALNPVDGQVYVTGFQIWGTVAPEISGLARLRWAGEGFGGPRELVTFEEGILVRFDGELDPTSARDPRHYSAERWEYRRTPAYGSPHYRRDGSRGQETLRPSAVHLSRDRRAVFVAIPDLAPVMQMRLGWAIRSASGEEEVRNAYFTVPRLERWDAAREGFDAFDPRAGPAAGVAQEDAAVDVPVSELEGARVAALMGCVACHSSDGSTLGRVGPSWKGLADARRPLADGTEVLADRDYLRESILDPARRVAKGFDRSDTGMPSYEGVLAPAQVESLIRYIESLR